MKAKVRKTIDFDFDLMLRIEKSTEGKTENFTQLVHKALENYIKEVEKVEDNRNES